MITLKEKGVKVILDTDGGTLKKVVNAGPFLIKPDIHEFSRLVEKNVLSLEGIIEYVKVYQNTVEYRILGLSYVKRKMLI